MISLINKFFRENIHFRVFFEESCNPFDIQAHSFSYRRVFHLDFTSIPCSFTCFMIRFIEHRFSPSSQLQKFRVFWVFHQSSTLSGYPLTVIEPIAVKSISFHYKTLFSQFTIITRFFFEPSLVPLFIWIILLSTRWCPSGHSSMS